MGHNTKQKAREYQRRYRAELVAKCKENIANGRPPEEGLPISRIKDTITKAMNTLGGKTQSAPPKIKTKESAQERRVYKANWAREKKAKENAEKLEQYERDFGKKTE